MALQFAVSTRNARLDAIEVDAGVSAILKIRTGAVPASCATADAGTVLATLTLPSDWMGAAAAGVKSMSGTWQDTSADAAGTAGHFRIYKSDGTTCIMQGSVAASGSDMNVNNVVFALGQPFNITSFAITEGNA